MNGAVRGHEFIGCHACIAHDDETGLRIKSDQFLHLDKVFCTGGILPDIVINGVVEEKGLQFFELGPGIIEKGLDHLHVRFHGPSAIVNGQDNLQAVLEAPVKYDLYLSGIFHGLVNGFIDIDHILGAAGTMFLSLFRASPIWACVRGPSWE